MARALWHVYIRHTEWHVFKMIRIGTLCMSTMTRVRFLYGMARIRDDTYRLVSWNYTYLMARVSRVANKIAGSGVT